MPAPWFCEVGCARHLLPNWSLCRGAFVTRGWLGSVQLLLGRRLVLAGLQALFQEPRAVREAILPVSLRAVAAKITIDWAHKDWNLRGLLDTSFGQWVFPKVGVGERGDLALRVLQERDKSPARNDATRSSADGSDFLSAASTCSGDTRDEPSAARTIAAAFSLCPVAEVGSASSCSTRSVGLLILVRAMRISSAHYVSYATMTCTTTLMVLRSGPATLWSVRAVRAASTSLASALYPRCAEDLCLLAILRLSTGLQHTCKAAPAHGAAVHVSRRAGWVSAIMISSSRRSPLAMPAALPSRLRILSSCGSMLTAPPRNRGFYTAALH